MISYSLNGDTNMTIVNVYDVWRQVEDIEFRHDMDHKDFLFHSSKVENFVGILSRWDKSVDDIQEVHFMLREMENLVGNTFAHGANNPDSVPNAWLYLIINFSSFFLISVIKLIG